MWFKIHVVHWIQMGFAMDAWRYNLYVRLTFELSTWTKGHYSGLSAELCCYNDSGGIYTDLETCYWRLCIENNMTNLCCVEVGNTERWQMENTGKTSLWIYYWVKTFGYIAFNFDDCSFQTFQDKFLPVFIKETIHMNYILHMWANCISGMILHLWQLRLFKVRQVIVWYINHCFSLKDMRWFLN